MSVTGAGSTCLTKLKVWNNKIYQTLAFFFLNLSYFSHQLSRMGFPKPYYFSKIIELSGAELQKMRVSLQKLQLQNWNLAQSNSQMLAVCLVFALSLSFKFISRIIQFSVILTKFLLIVQELNLGKDKVKVCLKIQVHWLWGYCFSLCLNSQHCSFQLKELRHELGCKNALLKAKNMELEVRSNLLLYSVLWSTKMLCSYVSVTDITCFDTPAYGSYLSFKKKILSLFQMHVKCIWIHVRYTRQTSRTYSSLKFNFHYKKGNWTVI